jgi:chemotaxis protein CheC
MERRHTLALDKAGGGFDLASWSKLASVGSTSAISGLAQMMNQDFRVTGLSLDEVSLRNAITLLGKADDQVVGIYLVFSGNASGHIMLAFQPSIAFELVDMAMGIPLGSTTHLGEMEKSVLGEIGNIAGSFFLNAVADLAGFRLAPSPPAVVVDMAGAIMGSVMAEVLDENESVFVIRLLFGTSSREIEGRFLVLPAFTSSEKAPESPRAGIS